MGDAECKEYSDLIGWFYNDNLCFQKNNKVSLNKNILKIAFLFVSFAFGEFYLSMSNVAWELYHCFIDKIVNIRFMVMFEITFVLCPKYFFILSLPIILFGSIHNIFWEFSSKIDAQYLKKEGHSARSIKWNVLK